MSYVVRIARDSSFWTCSLVLGIKEINIVWLGDNPLWLCTLQSLEIITCAYL